MTNEELYKRYKNLIYKTAKRHATLIKNSPSFSYEDIYQLASVGFIEACNTFDESKGTKFTTYAYKMMTWQIHKTLRSRRSIIQFPQYFNEIWGMASKMQCDTKTLLKVKPKCYSKQQVLNAMKWYNYANPASLDSQINEKGSDESREMYETVAGSTIDETSAVVNEFINSLSTKQKQVIYLLMNGDTQTEISGKLGISQPHVNRIIKSIRQNWLDKNEEESK